MKFVKLLFIALIGGIIIPSATAQDIHFSQFQLAPLHVNPALTGVIGCESRIVGNYRNQWASILQSKAFSTYAVSYDARLAVGKYDYVGLGGSIMADKVGTAAFSTIQGAFSGSYLKRLGGYRSNESYLVAGGQLAVTQRDINTSELIYGDQWDGGNGVSGPSAEQPFDPNFIFADISAGVLYFAELNRNNTSNYYVGMAFHHLNRANMSFTRRDFEALYSKLTIHAGGEFALGQKVALAPNFMYLKQGPSFEVNAGTAVKFRFGQSRTTRQAFSVGGYVRIAGHYESSLLSDAAILTTRFDFNDFTLGFSYDINVSSLSPATNSNGALELALMYRFCKDRKRRLSCPEF